MLVTCLNPLIGYDMASKVAKNAHKKRNKRANKKAHKKAHKARNLQMNKNKNKKKEKNLMQLPSVNEFLGKQMKKYRGGGY